MNMLAGDSVDEDNRPRPRTLQGRINLAIGLSKVFSVEEMTGFHSEAIHFMLQQREEAAKNELASATFNGPAVVATFSPKGGPGKTTIGAGEAITWSTNRRRDRAVVIGADSNAGTLSVKMGQTKGWSLQMLADKHDDIDSYEKLIWAFGFQGEGVMVVASDPSAERDKENATDFKKVVTHLSTYLNVFKIDCGIDFNNPLTQSVLDATDILVLVTDPTRDCLTTIDELVRKQGNDPKFGKLMSNGILVVNKVKDDTPYLDRIISRYERFFSRILIVNYDRQLDTGGEIVMEDLDYETRVQFTELSAAIAGCLSRVRPQRPEDQLEVPEIDSNLAWLTDPVNQPYGLAPLLDGDFDWSKGKVPEAVHAEVMAAQITDPAQSKESHHEATRFSGVVKIRRTLATATAFGVASLGFFPQVAVADDNGGQPLSSVTGGASEDEPSATVEVPPAEVPAAPESHSNDNAAKVQSDGGVTADVSSGEDSSPTAQVEVPPTAAPDTARSQIPSDSASSSTDNREHSGKHRKADSPAQNSAVEIPSVPTQVQPEVSKPADANPASAPAAAQPLTVTHPSLTASGTKADAASGKAAEGRAPVRAQTTRVESLDAPRVHSSRVTTSAPAESGTGSNQTSTRAVPQYQQQSGSAVYAPPMVGTVFVTNGDSLWKIASDALQAHLGQAPSPAEIDRYWHQIYKVAENHQVIGEDPDLILPGQRLELPAY